MLGRAASVEPPSQLSSALSIGLVVKWDPRLRTGTALRIRQTFAALRTQGDVTLYLLTRDEPDLPLDDLTIDGEVLWIPMTRRRLFPHDYVASLLGWRPRRLMAARLRHQRHIATTIVRPHDVVWTYGDRAFLAVPTHLRRSAYTVADLIDFEDQRDIELARRARRFRLIRTSLAKMDARALRRTLHGISRSANRTVISSEPDRQRLGAKDVSVFPNTYSPSGESVGRPMKDGAPRFLFVGFLAYGPNVDAVHWLVNEIWPAVARERPDAELRIVGQGLMEGAFSTVQGVTVVGEVDDIGDELRSAVATLAPLRVGSGTRLKILEGWAQRVPVITTSIGAEGLDWHDERDLLIADSSADFARAMVRIANDPSLREHLASNGQRLWNERYSQAAADSHVAKLIAGVKA